MKDYKKPFFSSAFGIAVQWMFWFVIFNFIFTYCISVGESEVSIVEIPIKENHIHLKRVPAETEFVYIGWIGGSGKMIAIPESQIQEFIELAEVLKVDPIGHPGAAVSNILTVKVEIIHEAGLSFWMDEGAYWISWNDEDPPIATVNGTEIVFYSNPPFPRAPVLINVGE